MKRILLFLYLMVLATHILTAGVTGKLVGMVTDQESGDPLAGTNVQVIGKPFGAATDINGRFIILNIPPGVYSIRVNYIGYESMVQEEVQVSTDLTTKLNFALSSTVLQAQEVVVIAIKGQIQMDKTNTTAVIRKDELDALPITSFTEALSLQAGVVGSGSNLHVRGGRANEVAYLIDGLYVQDPLFGGLATDIDNGAIQEMTLLSGTFNAEYGNSLSGVVNIVTREGGSKLSSSMEVQSNRISDASLVKPNVLNGTTVNSLSEYRFLGSLSGPLFINPLRFVLSGEINQQGSYLPFGYKVSKSMFGKLTYTGIQGMKLNLMTRFNNNERQNYSHSWKFIPERYYRSRSQSQHLALILTHTLSNHFFYDLRISSFNQDYYSGVDKDTSEYMPWSNSEYVPNVGTGWEFYANADPPELVDSKTSTENIRLDFFWQLGTYNELKFGGEYKKHHITLWEVYDPQRDNPYIDNYKTDPFEASAYFQDKIEFPFLVINLGLRFDNIDANAKFRENPLDSTSNKLVKSRYQISPRLGIAHPVSDRTKLHFAYGHFFQNPDFQYFYEGISYDIGVREPLFGQAKLDAERTIAYEVGLAHQLTPTTAFHLTAYYKDIAGLIGTRYYSAYSDDAPDRYVGYTLYINEDYANVKGFEMSMDIRPSGNFSGGMAYTYSVAKGSASSETEQYPGSSESTRLYFLGFDKTHVFNASGTYRIGSGKGPIIFGLKPFQKTDYSFIVRASSGYPYTPSGRDVGFVERNSLRRPSTYSMDLIMGKNIFTGGIGSCRVFIEVHNLTNHRNILYVYSDTGDPDYTIGNDSIEYMRDPSNYGPPRMAQIGLEWKY